MLFLSDGRPSDCHNGDSRRQILEQPLTSATVAACYQTIERIGTAFGFHAVGFGDLAEFPKLQAMTAGTSGREAGELLDGCCCPTNHPSVQYLTNPSARSCS